MIDIEVDADDLLETLQGATKELAEPPREALGEWGTEVVDGNFESGGNPRWATKVDGAPCFLEDTGALRDSVGYTHTKSGVEINYGLEYGNFHIEGTGRLPARDFMGVPSSEEAGLEDVASEWIDKAFEGP